VDANELAMHRLNTQAFISANPSTIALIPRDRQKTGTGVRWIELAPRPAQVLRLIDQSSTSGPSPGSVRAADGVQRRVTYQLLGTWDAAIGLYDTWVDAQGIRWVVDDLLPDNGYERRAEVTRYGES
jgi:hypothetical protein